MSRTKNSLMNITVGIGGQFFQILIQFISRSVFIYCLSAEYLGINGLFTNILTLLSLTELGFGTAIIYNLYEPIAKDDRDHIIKLMNLYKMIYRIIAILILLIGLCLVPFLGVLVQNTDALPNIKIIYLIYLLNSVASYCLIYKRSLIEANQKAYICTIYQKLFTISQHIVQIGILVLTRNYMLYLLMMIFFSVACNVAISIKADRMYPYLKEKNNSLPEKSEMKNIAKNTFALSLHRVGTIFVNNTDNILMSAFVSLSTVGLYSNYTLITSSLSQFTSLIFNAFTASIGNMGALESKDKIRSVFKTLNFVGFFVFGFCTTCLLNLFNPFIKLWIGETYLFSFSVVVIIVVNYYVGGMRQVTLKFRDALGLFWHDRYKALAEAIVNLILSIWLVQKIGVTGILLGTLFCTVFISSWVEPLILFKYGFESTVKEYFIDYLKYTISLIVIIYITYYLNSILIVNEGIVDFVLRCIITVSVYLVGIVIFYFKNSEFKNLVRRARSMISGVISLKNRSLNI